MAINFERRVLVDMDGVLSGFDEQVRIELEADHPEVTYNHSRLNFFIREDYSGSDQLIVDEIINRPGFLTTLPVVDGAIEGWSRIIELGCEPVICSSPLPGNPNSRDEKLNWLEEKLVPHFGAIVVDRALITRDKFRQPGIALVDDRPDLRSPELAAWTHILFDKPYNQTSANTLRLLGWRDPQLDFFLRVAASKFGAQLMFNTSGKE